MSPYPAAVFLYLAGLLLWSCAAHETLPTILHQLPDSLDNPWVRLTALRQHLQAAFQLQSMADQRAARIWTHRRYAAGAYL